MVGAKQIVDGIRRQPTRALDPRESLFAYRTYNGAVVHQRRAAVLGIGQSQDEHATTPVSRGAKLLIARAYATPYSTKMFGRCAPNVENSQSSSMTSLQSTPRDRNLPGRSSYPRKMC